MTHHKKTMTILLTTACLFCLLLCSCGQAAKLKDVCLSAKTPGFETLAEMEETADVIVIGKKIDEAYLLYHGEYPFATISNFRIDSVQKDGAGMLKEGDTIHVLENEFVYEKEKERHHVNGYTAMNTTDRYVLHLSANGSYYTPLGINYGVTSLGDQYQMIDYEGNGDVSGEYGLINRIRGETREKYREK